MRLYDQYGNPVGEKDDAHVLSNYKDWKKTAYIVTNVNIKWETTGMSVEDIIDMDKCLFYKVPFALVSKENTFICIVPDTLTISQGGLIMQYLEMTQLLNAIKLLIFNFNMLYIPSDEELNVAKKLS